MYKSDSGGNKLYLPCLLSPWLTFSVKGFRKKVCLPLCRMVCCAVQHTSNCSLECKNLLWLQILKEKKDEVCITLWGTWCDSWGCAGPGVWLLLCPFQLKTFHASMKGDMILAYRLPITSPLDTEEGPLAASLGSKASLPKTFWLFICLLSISSY